MASDSALPPVIGAIADDHDGNPLGTVTTVFLDDVTERPTWVGLTRGLHAAPDEEVPVIAPISDAQLTDGRLRLTVSADAVRSAPRVAQADRLSADEETTLRRHYLAVGTRAGTTDRTVAGTTDRTVAGAPTDSAMTRSEEQLQVGTVVEPWTRAVLRIEEVTEEVMVPVTITRQQARIEYLPLAATDAARATGDAAEPGAERATSASEWVTLYAEQPSVTLERVPVERVRLSTAWVTEQTVVSEQLRREQVELTTTEIPRVAPRG
jgi:stress response protein YsnF